MRFRFSNAFGTQPISFNAVTVALQDYSGNVVHGTITPVTFDGKRTVTIPPGEEIWSDGVALLDIWCGRSAGAGSQLGGQLFSGRQQSADDLSRRFQHDLLHHRTGQRRSHRRPDVFAYKFTTTSWFFLDAVDVMAPADTVVICAFGDPITDGTHTTLNENDRWSNALSRRLHNAYGNRVSIVNEAIGGNRVVNPVVTNATAARGGGSLGPRCAGPVRPHPCHLAGGY